MSRIGKLPVALPEGVKVEISGLNVKIQGPKGDLEKGNYVEVKITDCTSATLIGELIQ